LASEQYESLQLDLGEADKSPLTYMHLTEYLAKICLHSLENPDLRNCLGFLTLLIDRITDRFVTHLHTGIKTPLHYHFKLELM
jgi:hypothetical protein